MFKRICKGLSDIGTLVDKDSDVTIDNKTDYYESIYYYSAEQKAIADKKVEVRGKFRAKGVSGITDVVTDKLVWDLDSELNVDFAKKDAIELCTRLYSKGFKKEEVRICFSGMKGFSIMVIIDKMINPDKFKLITSSIAGDLKTYDSVVSNASRILRLVNTKHQKTGLFKTSFTFEELRDYSVAELKEYASGSYDDEVSKTWTMAKMPISLVNVEPVKKVVSKVDNSSNKGPIRKLKLDYSRNPLNLSPWKLALSQGLFPTGTRSVALMILAATLKAKRFDATDCYYHLKSSADKQAEIFEVDKFSKEEIYNNIISQVYGDNWNGSTYSTDNFPQKLRDFLEDLNIPENSKLVDGNALLDINEVFTTFDNYATNIEANTIKTGIDSLDDVVRITTSMLVGILGSPASGKTTALFQILNYMSMSGEESVFFSLDMGKPLVYQKLAQKCTNYSGEDILHYFKTGNEEKKQEVKTKIKKNYDNIQFCFKTGSSVDDMREYITSYEQTTGKKVRLVAVDYLEKVVGPYSDATANSGYVAKKLQELANDLELCVLVLLQPQKMAGDPSCPLLSYRKVKGSSLLEQEMRVILSLWREGYNPQTFEHDKYITFAVLKNTMGQTGVVDLGWDGAKGQISELSHEEKADLASFKKTKQAIRDLEKDKW